MYLWERQNMANIKLMFFSNCFQGPKIFYLYEKPAKEIPQLLNIMLLDNMYVFEFDLSKSRTVHNYNKYIIAKRFKLHDFFVRGVDYPERPLD